MTLVPAFEPPPARKSPSSDSQTPDQSFSSDQSAPKKKRSRITKEQLAHLERLFGVDCNPTATRRREIALQVGVPEKRIQVWFQNRRAKAKNISERNRPRPGVVSPPSDPPGLCQAVQTEFAALIQEDDPSIFVIPVISLTIGGWNRVNRDGQRDLRAWICERKRCLTWFVHSRDYGFKIQIPLENVTELEFKSASPAEGSLTISLSRPPKFFLKRDQPRSSTVPSDWKASDDFTEDKVASRVLQHILGGPALPLANIVGHIRNQMAANTTSVNLQPLPYHTSNYCPSSSSSPTSTYTSPRLNGTLYPGPTEHQPTSRNWNLASNAGTQHCIFHRSSVGLNSNRGLPSGTLGLHGMGGYSDSQVCNDSARFANADNNISPNRPSPLLVPLKQPYFHPQALSVDGHCSLPLPGLSELFAASEDM